MRLTWITDEIGRFDSGNVANFLKTLSDSGIHVDRPKTIVAAPNTSTAPSIFTPTLVFKGRKEKKIAVIAPAFLADCLETLEEMAERGRETVQRRSRQSGVNGRQVHLARIRCVRRGARRFHGVERFRCPNGCWLSFFGHDPNQERP